VCSAGCSAPSPSQLGTLIFTEFYQLSVCFLYVVTIRLALKSLRDCKVATVDGKDPLHVELACLLVSSCLQRLPEDRLDELCYLCGRFSLRRIDVLMCLLLFSPTRLAPRLCWPDSLARASADDLLYELRLVEDRGAFVVTADQLGMTPLDFEPAVRASRKVQTDTFYCTRSWARQTSVHIFLEKHARLKACCLL
jgi:hypothetical protein